MNDKLNKIGKTVKDFENNLAIKKFDFGKELSRILPKYVIEDLTIGNKLSKYFSKNNINDSFAVKLKVFLEKNNISYKELGNKLGVTEATVSNWFNTNRKPDDMYETVTKLSQIFDAPITDFLPDTLKQRKLITKQELKYNIDEYADLFPNKLLPSTVKTIQLINGYVGAGSFGSNDDLEVIDKIYVDIHTIEKAYRNKELQAIRVFGDSMKPYVSDGDIALFCKFKDGEVPNGDGKYIISTTQGEQIKNLKFMLNGNIRIISENPSYHTKDGYDEEINKESQEYLKIIGKVVGRILKG